MKVTEEKRTITLRGETVEYTLRRSDRVKPMRISVVIRGGGEMRVSVHTDHPLKKIEEYLHKQEKAIIDAIDRMKKRRPLDVHRQYTDGMQLFVLGKPVRLRIVRGSRGAVALRSGELLCTVPEVNDAESIGKVMERWLTEQCRQLVMPMLEEEFPRFAAMGAKRYTGVRFRAMTTRWGSNSGRTNALTFNTRLVEQPPEVIRYVVLHELCHFIERNHSASFYRLLDSVDPDRKKHERMLKQ